MRFALEPLFGPPMEYGGIPPLGHDVRRFNPYNENIVKLAVALEGSMKLSYINTCDEHVENVKREDFIAQINQARGQTFVYLEYGLNVPRPNDGNFPCCFCNRIATKEVSLTIRRVA
jgi:hypothetical protein